MATGNVGRKGAVRKAGTKKVAQSGTGGNRRKGLEGKKDTPPAHMRPGHPAYKRAQKGAVGLKRKPRIKKKESTVEYVLGRNPVLECLRAKTPASALYVAIGIETDDRIKESIALTARRGISILEVPKPDIDSLADNTLHQGIALQIPPFNYTDLEDILSNCINQPVPPLVLALDSITDTRNLGAIIRSAVAFGVKGIILPERRSVGVTAIAWRTSAGLAARIPIAQTVNLSRAVDKFAQSGFQVVGLALENSVSLDDYEASEPTLIVVGSEGKGISSLITKKCDTLVNIPMQPNVESLNASVAVSIVLSEFNRQHRLK